MSLLSKKSNRRKRTSPSSLIKLSNRSRLKVMPEKSKLKSHFPRMGPVEGNKGGNLAM